MKCKFGLITLLTLFISNIASAETLSEAMTKCSKVDNSLKRLVCYDKLHRQAQGYTDSELPARITSPSAHAGNSLPTANSPQQRYTGNSTAEERFGQRAPDKDIESLTATVAAKKKNRSGRMILTLSNGQVWTQIDDEYLGVKVGDSINIERGMLGSFLLRKSSGSKPIRVKRKS